MKYGPLSRIGRRKGRATRAAAIAGKGTPVGFAGATYTPQAFLGPDQGPTFQGGGYRGGSRLVSMGGPGISQSNGAELAEIYAIQEPGALGRLFVNGPALDAPLSDVILDNISYMYGYVPGALFGPLAFNSPVMGAVVGPQSKLQVVRRNATGATLFLQSSFQARPSNRGQVGGNVVAAGRALIALGQTTPGVAIGSASSATVQWDPEEPGIANRLVIQSTGDADIGSLVVTSVKHNNVNLLSQSAPAELFAAESWGSPLFGRFVDVSDSLTVTIENKHAVDAGAVTCCFTA